MIDDFNLLPEKEVLSTGERQQRRVVFLAGVILTIVMGLIFLGAYLFNNYLGRQLTDLDLQKSSLQSRFDQYHDLALNLIILNQKIAGIKEIQKRSFDFYQAATYVYSLAQPDIKITRLDVKDDSTLSFLVVAGQESAMRIFLTRIGQEETLRNIKELNISGLQLNDQKSFQTLISAKYGGGNVSK